LSSKKITTEVMTKEKTSAAGAAATTPQRPQAFPKIRRQGMRAINCLKVVRRMETFGRPVTTKRYDDTI
jgi:hypothetical protein